MFNTFKKQLGRNFLNGEPCQAGLPSGGIAAELRFHIINVVRRTKAVRVGPDEIERGITRRGAPLVRRAWGRCIAIEGHQRSKHAGALVLLNQ